MLLLASRSVRLLSRWGGRRDGVRVGEEEAESRVKMERLRCHACGDGPHATMPKLFEHLDKCVAAPPGETIRNIE